MNITKHSTLYELKLAVDSSIQSLIIAVIYFIRFFLNTGSHQVCSKTKEEQRESHEEGMLTYN